MPFTIVQNELDTKLGPIDMGPDDKWLHLVWPHNQWPIALCGTSCIQMVRVGYLSKTEDKSTLCPDCVRKWEEINGRI